MRALITDPDQINPATYRRFLQRVGVQGVFPDTIVDGSPYLALNAVVLDPHDVRELKRLTRIFAGLFQRAGEALQRDVETLVDLGFPWAFAEFLSLEPPRMPVLGRFDFVKDERGRWWVLEFNSDTPSGIREALVADRWARALLPDDALPAKPQNGALGERFASAFLGAVRAASVGADRRLGAVGFITWAAEIEDMAQLIFTKRLLEPSLLEAGFQVVLGSASNVRATIDGCLVCGHPVTAIYRYLTFESIAVHESFASMMRAVLANQLRLINGLFGFLLQHKALMAWLFDHRDDPVFTEEERDAIALHLPPTWRGPDPKAPRDREHLVAKEVFGREGALVVFGEDTSAERWQTFTRDRQQVLQERISVAPIEMAVPGPLGQERRRGTVVVGSFAVNGTWAGFYSRFDGKITKRSAKWVATWEA